MICCRGGVNITVGRETVTYIIDMVTEQPSNTVCRNAKLQLKPNLEQLWNNSNVFLLNDVQNFPEPLCAREILTEDSMGLPTDFKKEMRQTKLHAHHLVQVEVPVHPLLVNITNIIYMGTQTH